jgi:curved DNA-binding protein CbpA
MKDFYYILGVGFNSTLDEIKEAYRKLSKKFHPDLNPVDPYFENHFREIQEAYETLGNPDRRTRYDIILKKFKSNQQTSSPYGTYKRPRQPHRARPSDFYLSKNKRAGTGIKIVLVLVALILSIYIIESLSKSKKHVVSNNTAAVSTYVVKVRKHHRRRHAWISKSRDDSEKSKPDSISATTKTLQPAIVKAKQPVVNNPKPAIINNPKQLALTNTKQPEPVDKQQNIPINNIEHPNYLYTTYVIPNATGVINIRKTGDYSSEVIGTIPANSQVSVIEKGSVYYKVAFNNSVGYVPKWSLHSK